MPGLRRTRLRSALSLLPYLAVGYLLLLVVVAVAISLYHYNQWWFNP